MQMELSSRRRDTIALEVPDISYFSTNGTGSLEEQSWNMGNELLTYSISEF